MAGDFTTIQSFIDWTDNVANINSPLYTFNDAQDAVLELDIKNDYDRITVVWVSNVRTYVIKVGVVSYDVTDLYILASDVLTDVGWS